MFKGTLALRKPNHLHTRLEIRDELVFRTWLLRRVAVVYFLFAIIDNIIIAGKFSALFFLLRFGAIAFSTFMFYFCRGRTRYGIRIFLTVAPYVYTVEALGAIYNLEFTPYGAGIFLILFTAAMLFPLRVKVAAVSYGLYLLPLFLSFPRLIALQGIVSTCIYLSMLLGCYILCIVNCARLYNDLFDRLKMSEQLSRANGMKEKEIRRQAEQLYRRRVFENQLSPQVAKAVLLDPNLVQEKRKSIITNIVIDVQDSTEKISNLPIEDYSYVIDEVLDLFSATCLKWNITIDKYMGDGAQAFSGAPIPFPDDLSRALFACRDTILMIQGRKDSLESKWRGKLNLRFAVCKGEAVVGFHGKGIFKPYTASGAMVSFTHRLSSVPKPWTIALCDWTLSNEPVPSGFSSQKTTVEGLKGFGHQKFAVSILTLNSDLEDKLDLGRCPDCEGPLVYEESAGVAFKIYCPGCKSRLRAAG